MGLFDWFRGHRSDSSPGLKEWRRAWSASLADPEPEAAGSLRARLDSLALPEEEIEIEREMLEGLNQLIELRRGVDEGRLPFVETGHRLVGLDRCHFSAPVSMPEDAAQPSGRLLLTSSRAIFVGGPKATIVAWHAVADVAQAERDLIVVRRDRETIHRFRCNCFADAICAAYLARHLSYRAGRPLESRQT